MWVGWTVEVNKSKNFKMQRIAEKQKRTDHSTGPRSTDTTAAASGGQADEPRSTGTNQLALEMMNESTK